MSATILVVDDAAASRDLLSTLLGYGGHRMLEAADGSAALRLARLESPDLVITDILMPVMGGAELLRQLRADLFLAGIPVILCTAAHDRREAELLAARYRVEPILTKPCEPESILSAVAQALGFHSEDQPLRIDVSQPTCFEAMLAAENLFKHSEAGLAAAYKRAPTASQSGRRAIAYELHDDIGQELSTAKLSLQMLLRRDDAHAYFLRIKASISSVEAALARVRALSAKLRTAA